MMTNQLTTDKRAQETKFLPFAPGDLDRSGLRLTRAEFARFLDVSRQAVGEWVAAGKITLGTDGRLDPRQAVSQLMRNTDPARLRSKVLLPLTKQLSALAKRVSELETALSAANEDVEFHEGAAQDFSAQQDALSNCLQLERGELEKCSSAEVIAGLFEWIASVWYPGDASYNTSILGCIAQLKIEPSESVVGSPGALEVEKKEGE
jgi:hypothetical protein